MTHRAVYACMLLGAMLQLAACQSLLKKRDPDPAPSAAVSSAPVAVVTPLPTTAPTPMADVSPPPAAIDEATVPASQDFEDEAFTKVTAANFRAQFTQLKAEITKP